MADKDNVDISFIEDKISNLDSIKEIPKELKSNKKSNNSEDIVVNSNLTYLNIKKDLNIFKEEILRDFKRQQTKILEKEENMEKNTIEQLEEFKKIIERNNERINSLSNMIITDKKIREKVEMLIEFKNKNQEIIMTNGIQIKNLDRDLYDNIYRIDSILKDTILHPKILGSISRFQNFREVMDFILGDCSKNITFREKIPIDINNLKKIDERNVINLTSKIEKARKTLALQIDTFNKKFDSKINSLNDSFNERLANYRIENMTYSDNFKKATESLTKQMNSVIQAKTDIINKFDEKINILNKDNNRMKKYFTDYKNEFIEMRRLFKEMIETLNSKNININNNFDLTRKIKKFQRKQTVMLKDLKSFEDNKFDNNNNNIIRSINMNDMFMNPQKVSFNNNFLKEKENSQDKVLRTFKRINTAANVGIKSFFEKNNILNENQKNDLDIKKIKPPEQKFKLQKKPMQKKKHHKKIKFLSEIYLVINSPNNIDIIRRKLHKFNSICVPNKKLRLNLFRRLKRANVFLKSKEMKTIINNNNKNNLRDKKKINLLSENIFDTSISKSQNSIFSKSSEKSEEKRINIIKTKYKTNLVIKETKEIDASNTLDKESIEKPKINTEVKVIQEDKTINNNSNLQNYEFEIQTSKNKLNLKSAIFEKRKEKMEKSVIKLEEKKKEISKSLNKIYISIDGSNKLEIDPYSIRNDSNQKDIVNNVKILKDNKTLNTLTGYPKIVTNNGENIIYSSRPIFNRNKFINYTNPNVIALNYSINNLYEDKRQKLKKRIEMNPNNFLDNNQLLSKIKGNGFNQSERSRNNSLNIFKNSNLSSNLYLSQKQPILEYNIK